MKRIALKCPAGLSAPHSLGTPCLPNGPRFTCAAKRSGAASGEAQRSGVRWKRLLGAFIVDARHQNLLNLFGKNRVQICQIAIYIEFYKSRLVKVISTEVYL